MTLALTDAGIPAEEYTVTPGGAPCRKLSILIPDKYKNLMYVARDKIGAALKANEEFKDGKAKLPPTPEQRAFGRALVISLSFLTQATGIERANLKVEHQPTRISHNGVMLSMINGAGSSVVLPGLASKVTGTYSGVSGGCLIKLQQELDFWTA